MKIVWPNFGGMELSTTNGQPLDMPYLIGLGVFALVVVGYTMAGGFLAAVWTDLFQSVVMWLGVMLLLGLTWWKIGDFESATRTAVQHTSTDYAFAPGYSEDGRQFLTPALALSYFFVWIFGGMGAPATLVRLMACRDTQTIRRSVFLLSVYNAMIYLPLVLICVAARSVMPELGDKSDEVVPRMALWTTQGLPGGSLLAGLVLVAPFGAVMATVSSYLVLIASGLVRDVYLRFVRPQANHRELKWITGLAMILVGLIAVASNLTPVKFLQVIVVFCTSCGAASFSIPALMAAFWRRATAAGAVAAMLAGATISLTLLVIGVCSSSDPMLGPDTSFRPYFLGGLEPAVWGIGASLVTGITVSLLTRPPSPELLAQLFDEQAA
jgi:SSS family solute:Na+ symporter/sodium/pantothenate symporter